MNQPRLTKALTKLVQKRFFSGSISSPLQLLRNSSAKLSLCDHVTGFRTPDKHWVFAVAVSVAPDKAPVLRTMNIQRVTDDGIDFITKKGFASKNFASENPVSIMHTSGEYTPGEVVQQWRAEGVCEALDLSEIIQQASDYTVSGIIASTRVTEDNKQDESKEAIDDKLTDISEGRNPLRETSQFTDIIQSTRNELEAGSLPIEELKQSIEAFRFCPSRVELMVGGPDQLMWNRWEWQRSEGDSQWSEPKHILPH